MEKHQRETSAAGDKIDYIKEQIEEARREKNKLEEECQNLMRTPFFKKEADNSNYQKMEDLKSQIDKQARETEKHRALILQHAENIKDLEKEKKDLEQDRDYYNKDLKRPQNVVFCLFLKKKTHIREVVELT